MQKWLLALFLTLAHQVVTAQQWSELKTGDLLFIDLDCGPLCDAIEAVTQGYQNQSFSHVGLVHIVNDSAYVIEALGKAVGHTPLAQFLTYSKKPAVVGRVKPRFSSLVSGAIAFSIRQKGVPYDDQFLYSNGKYYCSELVYDAFKDANGGEPFFPLFPMTYKAPGTPDFFPVWVDYFARLKMEIPEGKPGCNPGGISRSEKLEILGTYP